MKVTNCGVIPFHRDQVVMIRTPKGRYSFPKGKRENGEDELETAYRELKEESGIDHSQIVLLRDQQGELVTLDEVKTVGAVSYIIRYFIGELIDQIDLLVENPEEIEVVEYYPIKAIPDLPLSEARHKMFREAVQIRGKIKVVAEGNPNPLLCTGGRAAPCNPLAK
jgi:8-oxo-dGTP pyrophosphatase MutT (NUDIX family)